jgi:hypothetical protein
MDNPDEIDIERVLGVVLNAIARTMPDDAFEALIASFEREAAIVNTQESFLLFGYVSKLRGDPLPHPPERPRFEVIQGGVA